MNPNYLFAVAMLFPLMGMSAPSTFSIADPKGVNSVAFRVDSPLHSIVGFACNLRGEVIFDPESPTLIKGSVEAPLTGFVLPNLQMRDTLMLPDWMNLAAHPVVKLEISGAKGLKLVEPGSWAGTLTGNIHCRGTVKPVEMPIQLRYGKEQARARGGARNGDLLFLKSEFVIKRSDFGIKPSGSVEKVGDEVEISGEVVGYSSERER